MTEGPTAPPPGWTTVVAPASAILMTLASSTLFIIEEIGEGTLERTTGLLYGYIEDLKISLLDRSTWKATRRRSLLHNGYQVLKKFLLHWF